MLGVPNEDRLLGYGVSTCATCDGFFFRDQHIAVAGGGDSAMEEALFLPASPPRSPSSTGATSCGPRKIMQERVFANPKIEFAWNSVITDIIGDTKVSGVVLGTRSPARPSELDGTGLFVAIGHEPNTVLIKGQLELDDMGYVRTFDGTTRTSVDGVFACGDVQDHFYRQAVTVGGVGVHGRHRRRALARGAGQWRRSGNRTRSETALYPLTRRCDEREDRDPDDATFDEHVKASDVPVLVDFWAEWCGPCKMISPVLEEIAEEQAGKLRIGKLNIDDNLDVTRRFDVMSIPTLILFKDGEPQVRLIGAKPKGQLLEEISAYL